MVDNQLNIILPVKTLSHRAFCSTSCRSKMTDQADTKTRTVSRSDIIERILQGQNIVIYERQAINLTRWAKVHPGGELAVLHFVGRDATDEMTAYHSAADLAKTQRFVLGRIADEDMPWRPLAPPISLGFVADSTSKTGWRREGDVTLGEQAKALSAKLAKGKAAVAATDDSVGPVLTRDMLELAPDITNSGLDLQVEAERSKAYHQLRQRLLKARMFEMPDSLGGYGSDIVRYSLLAAGALYFYLYATSIWGEIASAALLGALWHQLTFVAHDAGHNGITGDAFKDRLIGTLIADYVGGLSLGWWKDNHNIHHLVTNHPEHDPDIQHIPFFAISGKFFGSLWSTYYKRVMAMDAFSKVLIGVQHKVYYVVLSLARFNLYANSYGFLALKARRNGWFAFEAAGVAFFWLWFGGLLYSLPNAKSRLLYLLVSHVVASPVHVQVSCDPPLSNSLRDSCRLPLPQIVLSHFARSTDDLGPIESFPTRQLRTTMDVVCSPWIEFFHGGLHMQVTHHLFPRIPRHNLRKASALVKEYCKEQDLEFAEYSFVEG